VTQVSFEFEFKRVESDKFDFLKKKSDRIRVESIYMLFF
jgi:hypothetical protein